MKPEIRDVIVRAAGQYGVDPEYMLRTARIESLMNPRARNPVSNARGLFQFIPSTARSYRLSGETIYDPVANSMAAARLTRANALYLARQGIPTDHTWLYIAHQQGAGGARELWRGYKANGAIDQLPKTIRRNVLANIPAGKRKTIRTVRDFVGFYGEKMGVPSLGGAPPETDIVRQPLVRGAGAVGTPVVMPRALPIAERAQPASEPAPVVSRLEWQPFEFRLLGSTLGS